LSCLRGLHETTVSYSNPFALTYSRTKATAGGSKLQVMIVEDRPGVLATIEAMVESWREADITSVDGFTNASAWIKAVDHLDLLLCDVRLPGKMDGLELARMAVAAYPSIAIVMFSADPRWEIDGLLERHSFLRKPFGRDALIAQIDDAFLRVRKPVSLPG